MASIARQNSKRAKDLSERLKPPIQLMFKTKGPARAERRLQGWKMSLNIHSWVAWELMKTGWWDCLLMCIYYVYIMYIIYICIYVCICIHIYIYTSAYIYIHIYISTYIFTCTYLCIYIYIDPYVVIYILQRQRDRERERSSQETLDGTTSRQLRFWRRARFPHLHLAPCGRRR